MTAAEFLVSCSARGLSLRVDDFGALSLSGDPGESGERIQRFIRRHEHDLRALIDPIPDRVIDYGNVVNVVSASVNAPKEETESAAAAAHPDAHLFAAWEALAEYLFERWQAYHHAEEIRFALRSFGATVEEITDALERLYSTGMLERYEMKDKTVDIPRGPRHWGSAPAVYYRISPEYAEANDIASRYAGSMLLPEESGETVTPSVTGTAIS